MLSGADTLVHAAWYAEPGYHTEVSRDLLRASDSRTSSSNSAKARARLGWQAKYRMPDVARMMVAAERGDTDSVDWLE